MRKSILAIDPGPTQSALVRWPASPEDRRPGRCGIHLNQDVLDGIAMDCYHDVMAIEMVAHFGTGMPAGKDVFETCVWIGRFIQQRQPKAFLLVYRMDVKMFLCGNARAKDANIRQAIIDRLGPPGTKKQPGPTYGIHSHEWSALAVALTAEHLLTQDTLVRATETKG